VVAVQLKAPQREERDEIADMKGIRGGIEARVERDRASDRRFVSARGRCSRRGGRASEFVEDVMAKRRVNQPRRRDARWQRLEDVGRLASAFGGVARRVIRTVAGPQRARYASAEATSSSDPHLGQACLADSQRWRAWAAQDDAPPCDEATRWVWARFPAMA